ncbi:DUF1294 domain-containing protein [Neobacillus vireti]|uniref:Membrane component n=1 Tax=Neobacillus vireti LMG 21834 TaxID=1131730 RepID=A0AB94INF7_9BACI|nr:DUF1294 domain-containing protein [Neobacillus vireti]ETI68522.1 putative membrane component [Neobacillus vireti LMG 21834]KLT16169.1 membrane protein [Neobacillus vireti]
MKVMLAVIFIMNIIGLWIMGEDKKRAKKHEYRIRERTLWLVALFGGAVGATAGMQLYRHKTKHVSFKIGFPVLAIIELILFVNWLI